MVDILKDPLKVGDYNVKVHPVNRELSSFFGSEYYQANSNDTPRALRAYVLVIAEREVIRAVRFPFLDQYPPDVLWGSLDGIVERARSMYDHPYLLTVGFSNWLLSITNMGGFHTLNPRLEAVQLVPIPT